MADSTINGLTAITGANVDNTADQLAIWDNSDSTTKKITRTELMVGLPAGTAAAPAISFSGDTDTGIYNSGANQLSIAVNGNEAFRVSSNLAIRLNNGTAANPVLVGLNHATTGLYWPTTSTLGFSTGGAEAMRIDSAQRLLVGGAASFTIPDGAGTGVSSKICSIATSGTASIAAFVNDGTNNRRIGLFVDQTNALCGISSNAGLTPVPFVYRDNAAERFRITTTGEVQIAAAGTAAAPAMCVGGDTNTGTFAISSDTFGFSTGGAEAMRIDSGQRLLVGGTSSFSIQDGAGASVTAKLAIAAPSGSVAAGVVVQDGTNNRRVGLFVDNTNGFVGISSSYSAGAVPFVYRDATAERLRITTNGEVQIAAAGTAALPAITIGGDTDTGLWYSSNNSLAIAAGGGTRAIFNANGITVNVAGSAGAPSLFKDSAGLFWPSGTSIAISTGGVEALRIDASQQVQIASAGTAAAPAIIVGGDVDTGMYSNGANVLAFATNGTLRFSIGSSGRLYPATTGTVDEPSIARGGDADTGMWWPATNTLGFSTNATERLRLDANGNVIAPYATAAIATTATDGFLYVSSCAGTPTGTPSSYTGRVPIVVDTTNNKLYFYSGGAWRDAGP